MSDTFDLPPRPDDLDALLYEADLSGIGLDREDMAMYAQLRVQEEQGKWDQSNMVPQDAYSVLAGLYRVSRDQIDPYKVTLTRGNIEPIKTPKNRYNMDRLFIVDQDATPISATMAKLGNITLYHNSLFDLEHSLNGVQFDGDETVYPALGLDAYSIYDSIENKQAESSSEVVQLGYVAPSLLEPKDFLIPELVPGRDYYRKGWYRIKDDHGNTFVVEPDGARWYEQSGDDGLIYQGPEDQIGYYLE